MRETNSGRPIPGVGGDAALVVAHPGHELRVHGWLELARPTVFVLTDGSGGCGQPRIASSAAVVARAGARVGGVFGRHTDRDLYAALLVGDWTPFLALARDLYAALDTSGCTCVVADWRDGYNSLHDVCRFIVEAVVARLRRDSRQIDDFACVLVESTRAGNPVGVRESPPPGPEPPAEPPAFTLRLDQAAFERKLAAARGYAGLEHEVQLALERDAQSLQVERLYVPSPARRVQPYYELYGERQVAAGRYTSVLRFEPHVMPLVRALADDAF